MTTRRKDDVERTTISAHVDKQLVEYLEDQRLSKSEWVERGLRLVLEQTMNKEQLAHKLKMEAEEAKSKIERAERRLEQINKKAEDTFGTTLDDYFEKHDPKNMREKQRQQFIDGWLDEYTSRKNNTTPEHIAGFVFDTVLERQFGLSGDSAIQFVRECLDEIGVNTTSNTDKQGALTYNR